MSEHLRSPTWFTMTPPPTQLRTQSSSAPSESENLPALNMDTSRADLLKVTRTVVPCVIFNWYHVVMFQRLLGSTRLTKTQHRQTWIISVTSLWISPMTTMMTMALLLIIGPNIKEPTMSLYLETQMKKLTQTIPPPVMNILSTKLDISSSFSALHGFILGMISLILTSTKAMILLRDLRTTRVSHRVSSRRFLTSSGRSSSNMPSVRGGFDDRSVPFIF